MHIISFSVLIRQVEKLRLREAKWLVQGHAVRIEGAGVPPGTQASQAPYIHHSPPAC